MLRRTDFRLIGWCVSFDRAKAAAHSMRRSHRLKHAQAGCVSIAMDGSDFAISMCRSLKLDESHQVDMTNITLA
eukprot:scaffold682362_cov69-Prasinocladus_malaysianus.AAC.1